ncbi:DUF58 domain-containing protein [Neiella marina]|uniref:DUF58 domain-containing protein n=1 Tax=Neiella holothuriorum TaxID=2870530 RepID=A0ABS7EFH8_9GAMM|nr:DUF58 domain-containing protein [Neiella holothuriorum]MBW8190432.1 DUF58 domain-containing protein [Neiella holothuriorum]
MNWWRTSKQQLPKPDLGDGVHVSMEDLLACQKLAGLLALRPDPRNVGRRHGQYLSRMKGRGMEFSEVRVYQQGDDIRAIDWRITARTGKPHTKLYDEERERPIFILLDLNASMKFGASLYLKSAQACYLAAGLAWSAFSGGDRIGIVTATSSGLREVPARPRRQGLTAVLETIVESHQQLLQAPPEQTLGSSLASAAEHLRRHAHTGALIAVISDFQHMDDATRQGLSLLKRHNQVMTFQLYDPLEQQLADVCQHDLCISDGSNTGNLNLSNKTVQQNYRQFIEQRQRMRTDSLSQLSRHQYQINAAVSLEQQLQQHGQVSPPEGAS